MRQSIAIIQRHLRLLISLLSIRLKRQTAYAANFWTVLLVDGSMFLMQLIVFNTLFLSVDTINGWNRLQLQLFIGTFVIIDSIQMCLTFFGVIGIPEKIRTGKLDLVLVKPVNTLFLVSFEAIDIGAILTTIPGIIMVVLAVAGLGIPVTVGHVTGYLLLLAVMTILFYSMIVIIRTLAFRFIRLDAIGELENELISFSFRVPGVVLRGALKVVFTFVLPYSIIATMPARFLSEGLSSGQWLTALGIPILFFIVANTFWRKSLAGYQSAA